MSENRTEDFRVFREELSDYFKKRETGTLTRNIEWSRVWRRLARIADAVVYGGKFRSRMRDHPLMEYSAEGYRIYMAMNAAGCWNKSKARETLGGSTVLEHVYPKVAMVRAIYRLIENGSSNKVIESFLVEHYRLAIISKAEEKALNSTAKGKSDYIQDRLKSNGILVFSAEMLERSRARKSRN